jgi:Uma2 family endonuclease
MATIDKPSPDTKSKDSFFDEDGFPWLENGERLDQKTFHERYEKLPPGFKAELIGGIVYVMPSPLKIRHGDVDSRVSGWLYFYRAFTPGTRTQNNTTTILADDSEPQPDSALLILPEYGGQSIDGEDEYTHGAPEFIAEVAWSSRSIDLNAKLRDYERAGVLEYFVRDLKKKAIHWFALEDGKFVALAPDPDGLFRSRAFPGLWLDPAAMLAGDDASVIATLQRGLASPEHAAIVAELARRREARAAKP